MEKQLKSFEEVKVLLKNSTAAWDRIIEYIRTNYVVDELWDGKDELKFRRSGRTLATFYIKDGFFTALIIFGKKEREKFEESGDMFSDYINGFYTNSKTYHDGKWMFIDVVDTVHAADIIGLINIKKKPNNKK